MKTIVVLPTYNEVENISECLRKLFSMDFIDVLVVDDGSSDGTADVVKSMNHPRLFLIERPCKLGLGTAYVTGFRWGLSRGYELFFEMDADLSHDPLQIPNFVDVCGKGYDVVIGSRYIRGTISVVGWDFKRLLLSKFANAYAKKILGISDLTDLTSGYRCYTRRALEAINLEKIRSNGYAFQIEMTYRALKSSCRLTEIPIIFYERNGGSSKMNRQIALEAAVMVWKLRMGF